MQVCEYMRKQSQLVNRRWPGPVVRKWERETARESKSQEHICVHLLRNTSLSTWAVFLGTCLPRYSIRLVLSLSLCHPLPTSCQHDTHCCPAAAAGRETDNYLTATHNHFQESDAWISCKYVHLKFHYEKQDIMKNILGQLKWQSCHHLLALMYFQTCMISLLQKKIFWVNYSFKIFFIVTVSWKSRTFSSQFFIIHIYFFFSSIRKGKSQ